MIRAFVLLMTMLGAIGSVAADEALPSRAALTAEVAEKLSRVQKLLAEKKLGGLLISKVRNFSWLSGGLGDNHIVITSEDGAASLLVLADGRKFLVASNSEAARLETEDLAGLGFQLAQFRWYEDKQSPDQKRKLIDSLAAGKTIATDTPYGNLPMADSAALHDLQTPLTNTELQKYRWLGKHTAEAVAAALARVKPGMSEREMEAIASDELLRRQIRPTVLLMGTDERIYKFRHAVPSDAVVKRYAMVNVCARRWGLVIAVTRFVHFGPIPADLAHRLESAARVGATMAQALKPGVTAKALFDVAKAAYKSVGFPDEWQAHHQGGAIGYEERDFLIHPSATESVHDRQAFAFNPSIAGAKVEDTIVLIDGHVENLTATPTLPTLTVKVGGRSEMQPAIWVRTEIK